MLKLNHLARSSQISHVKPQRPMDESPSPEFDLRQYKTALVADLDRVAARNRWGRSLMLIGWVHLAAFGWCQAMDYLVYPNGLYVATWGVEFFLVLAVMRWVSGRDWYRSTPLSGTIARVWGTFLILSFNLISLNNFTGIETLAWFKPALATLSSFGFMVMAYLVSGWFFLPAVQMYFTGLLMVNHPFHAFLIYGVSWWAVLQVIGVILERRRKQVLGLEDARSTSDAEPEPVAVR